MSRNRLVHFGVLAGLFLAGFAVCPALSARGEDVTVSAAAKRVAVLVFSGVELLDFAGPAEIFAGARDDEQNPLFEVYTVGIAKKPIKSMRFLTLTPQFDATDAGKPDILVLPGGNVEAVMNNAALLQWIEQQREAGCLLFSVCNGASVLAKLGYLDGLEVATHHDNIALLELLAPAAKCRRDCKFVDNGKVVTAAGISSGIDAALYVVSRISGPEVAKRVATYIEYDHYTGLGEPIASQPIKDEHGVIRQAGRVHESEPWGVVRLINILRDQGQEAAVKAYPGLLEATNGTDKDMLQSAGISMSATWLLRHGRDRQIAMALLHFNVAANPDSPLAHTDLGKALLDDGMTEEARKSFTRALELDPQSKRAKELLAKCQ